MSALRQIDDVRAALGPYGASLGVGAAAPPVADQLDGVRRIEAAGYRAIWTNEMIGADTMVRAALWLGATARVVVGTCIANMWARPAPTAHAAATQLVQAHPGRFVLGLGVGWPQQAAAVGRDYGRPVETARDYVSQLADREYALLLAANGPRMTALASELADGAFPADQPVEVLAQARERIGPDALVAVYVSIGNAGPDELRARVAAYRDVGADHVVLGTGYDADFNSSVQRFVDLAGELG